MTIIQCLGGWCVARESCAHYHAPQRPGREPIERLCEPGKDEPEPMPATPAARHEAERSRLAADPRFAAWVAGT